MPKEYKNEAFILGTNDIKSTQERERERERGHESFQVLYLNIDEAMTKVKFHLKGKEPRIDATGEIIIVTMEIESQ